MSRFNQREQENDDQFNLLANKLSSLRSITEEINTHANNQEVLDSLSGHFDNMLTTVKNTAGNLTRSMNMGSSTWRLVGIMMVLFFVLWTLYKLF